MWSTQEVHTKNKVRQPLTHIYQRYWLVVVSPCVTIFLFPRRGDVSSTTVPSSPPNSQFVNYATVAIGSLWLMNQLRAFQSLSISWAQQRWK